MSAQSRARQTPKVIGQAMQQAHARAVAANPPLSGRDWRVLSALQALTLAYHRLSDRLYASQIADLAGVRENHMRASLQALERAGVIVREKSRGGRYGRPSLFSFPAADTATVTTDGDGSAGATVTTNEASTLPDSGVGSTLSTLPSDTPPTLPKDAPSTLPRSGEPACIENPEEKTLEEHSAAANGVGPAAAAVLERNLGIEEERGVVGDAQPRGQPVAGEPEPEAFRRLVQGFGLDGRGRRDVLAAWRASPDAVEQLAAEARDHGDRPAGLLVRLVRDGKARVVEADAALELADAATYGVTATCPVCDGAGLVAGDDDGGALPCPVCRSSGETDRACRVCSGAIHVDGETCGDCSLTGLELLEVEWRRLNEAPNVRLSLPGWALLAAGVPLPAEVVPPEHMDALRAAGYTVLSAAVRGAA